MAYPYTHREHQSIHGSDDDFGGAMGMFPLQLSFVFVELTPPEWVCRESEP
jgi:hypothetical protein